MTQGASDVKQEIAVCNLESIQERTNNEPGNFREGSTGKKLVYFTGPDGILLEFAEYCRPEG